MSKRTMALAAVLLAGGIGAASAQGQMQMPAQGAGQVRAAPAEGQQIQGRQGQGTGQAGNAGAAKSLPPYSQQVQMPATAPLGPNVNKPKVNPSAAGTVTQGETRSPQRKASDETREHSGSVGSNANTHPFKALRAGGEPRQEGMTAPSGIYPPPSSTMNRDAGR